MDFLKEIETLIELYEFEKNVEELPKITDKSKKSYSEEKYTHVHKIINSNDKDYFMLELIYNSNKALLFQYKREKVFNPLVKFTTAITRKRLCYGNLFYDIKLIIESKLPKYEIRKMKIKKLLNNN